MKEYEKILKRDMSLRLFNKEISISPTVNGKNIQPEAQDLFHFVLREGRKNDNKSKFLRNCRQNNNVE